MSMFKKIDSLVEDFQVSVSYFLFSLIVVLGSIAVFSRFIFNLSIIWAEEVLRFSCIWLVFVGSALTVRKDGHVSIDILQEAIKNPKIKAFFYVISRLIGVIFLICLIPPSFELISKTRNSMAASLPLRFSYVYAAVPFGIFMMLWSYMTTLPKSTLKILNERKQ